jgi:hypothetical protein
MSRFPDTIQVTILQKVMFAQVPVASAWRAAGLKVLPATDAGGAFGAPATRPAVFCTRCCE